MNAYNQADTGNHQETGEGLLVKYPPLENHSSEGCLIISGFPYDEGTTINGGRAGGAVASTVMRNLLMEAKLGASNHHKIYDSGDIQAEQSLPIAHQNLTKKQKELLSKNSNSLVLALGGSNDQSFCNVSALMNAFPDSRIGVINLDSHFDVRPLKEGKAHSGSPFRLMLEHPIFIKNNSKFIEFAVKGATCSNEHYKYLQSKEVEVYWMSKDIRMRDLKEDSKYDTQGGQLFDQIMNKLEEDVDIIFVSFDLDSIKSQYMPGVSAPSPIGGLTAEEAIEIVQRSSSSQKVKIIDFSEFNPAVQTFLSSHLIREMVLEINSGFSQRSRK